jgi:hypothetical protein
MTHQHQAYCQQLLLDCDDPIFQGHLFQGKKGGPTKKMRDLANPRSEDAVTWSVFRLLDRHFGDQPWLSELLALAECDVTATGTPNVTFWEKRYPPQERLLWLLNNTDDPRVAKSDGARNDPERLPLVRQNLAEYRQRIEKGQVGQYKWVLEGRTEFDAVIRCPGLLVAVEAKLYCDVSTSVRWDRGRDQIARVIDAGLGLSSKDGFVFLLVTDWRQHDPPKEYERLMEYYRTNPPSGLSASRLGWLTWGEIYHWLERRRTSCTAEQGAWLDRLSSYLAERELLETQ